MSHLKMQAVQWLEAMDVEEIVDELRERGETVDPDNLDHERLADQLHKFWHDNPGTAEDFAVRQGLPDEDPFGLDHHDED